MDDLGDEVRRNKTRYCRCSSIPVAGAINNICQLPLNTLFSEVKYE